MLWLDEFLNARLSYVGDGVQYAVCMGNCFTPVNKYEEHLKDHIKQGEFGYISLRVEGTEELVCAERLINTAVA